MPAADRRAPASADLRRRIEEQDQRKMFKVGRWRSEKNRIRAVFKLQLQVTQVPKLGSEMLMVSLVPVDVGRATAKSEKVAPAIDGTCNWKKPIHEMVKLAVDSKTGKINEKVYHFIVSAAGTATGSSTKVGFWGEATVNLADYAEAFKPASLSLPLRASNTGAILHVTIQRMQNDGEEREYDEGGDTTPVRQQRRTLQSQLGKCGDDEAVNMINGMNDINSTEDGSLINSQSVVKFLSNRNYPLLADYNSHLQKNHSFDAVSTCSDTSIGIYTVGENNIRKNDVKINSTSLLSPVANGNTQKIMTSSGDWSGTSAPDGSTDGSTSSSGETGLRELQDPEDNIQKLRSKLVLLARKVEVSDLEVQTLKKQIIKECKRGKDLSREVSSLKEERDALGRECEELKLSQRIRNFTGNATVNSQLREDPQSILEEIKQELDHEKNTNANLRLQLEKTQEANSELILAVKDLDDLLQQRNKEMQCIGCSKLDSKEDASLDSEGINLENRLQHLHQFNANEHLFEEASENDAEEQYALDMLLNKSMDMAPTSSLEQKIIGLTSEVEMYRKEREDLEMQMEQLALDYEILKQENHDISSRLEQTQLREQLRMQYECSAHLAVINDLETQVECLEKELQNQAEAFEEDLATITLAKVEQEKRAIQAEEDLRKAKCKNADAVDRIQKEVKRLSAQMSHAFDWNEKLVLQAVKEASDLQLQNSQLNGLLEKNNEDLVTLQRGNHVKFQQLLCLIDFKSHETDGLLLELQEKREELENHKKTLEAMTKTSSEEMKMLKTEIEKLKAEKGAMSDRMEVKEKQLNEMEKLRTSSDVNVKLIQDKDLENAILTKEVSLLKEEVNKALEELNNLRNIKDSKDAIIKNLESEVTKLTMQYSELEHSFSRDGLGKNQKRPVYNVGEGPYEEEMFTITEENVEEICIPATTNDGHHIHESSRSNTFETENGIGHQKKPAIDIKAFMHGSSGDDQEHNIRNDEVIEEETMQHSDSSAYGKHKITQILSEMATLKEQNEIMGSELKEMQERYLEISLKFAEVEGERQKLVMRIRTLKNALRN